MNKQRQKEKIVKSIKNSTASKKLSSEDICAIADALIKAGFAEIKSFAEYIGGTIAGHSNYHGDTILSALYCAAEGKEIDYLKPLNITEYGYKEAIKAKQELQDEIARLTAENERLRAENAKIDEYRCVIADISEQCEQLKAENASLRARLDKAVILPCAYNTFGGRRQLVYGKYYILKKTPHGSLTTECFSSEKRQLARLAELKGDGRE